MSAHEVATRRTADGILVRFWSDGTLSGQLHDLPGIGRKRLPEGAVLAFREEVWLMTARELAGRFRVYRAAAKRLVDAPAAEYRIATAIPEPRPGAFRSALAAHVRDCRALKCRVCGF